MTAHELTQARQQAARYLATPEPPQVIAPPRCLPVGVAKSGNNTFTAQVHRNGKTYHGGTHATIDQAMASVEKLRAKHPKVVKRKSAVKKAVELPRLVSVIKGKRVKPFRVQIRVGKKHFSGGTYATIEEAEKAAKVLREKHPLKRKGRVG